MVDVTLLDRGRVYADAKHDLERFEELAAVYG